MISWLNYRKVVFVFSQDLKFSDVSFRDQPWLCIYFPDLHEPDDGFRHCWHLYESNILAAEAGGDDVAVVRDVESVDALVVVLHSSSVPVQGGQWQDKMGIECQHMVMVMMAMTTTMTKLVMLAVKGLMITFQCPREYLASNVWRVTRPSGQEGSSVQ